MRPSRPWQCWLHIHPVLWKDQKYFKANILVCQPFHYYPFETIKITKRSLTIKGRCNHFLFAFISQFRPISQEQRVICRKVKNMNSQWRRNGKGGDVSVLVLNWVIIGDWITETVSAGRSPSEKMRRMNVCTTLLNHRPLTKMWTSSDMTSHRCEISRCPNMKLLTEKYASLLLRKSEWMWGWTMLAAFASARNLQDARWRPPGR